VVLGHPSRSAFRPTDHVQQDTHQTVNPSQSARKNGAVPNTNLFAWGEEESGGHVL
jgi:hypothetical protein